MSKPNQTETQLPLPCNNYLIYAFDWLRKLITQKINSDRVPLDAVTLAQEKMWEAANYNPSSPFLVLCRNLGLNSFEHNLLLLVLASEYEPDFVPLFASAQKNDNLAYPCLALAQALFERANWKAIAPQSPLRYWRLIEVYPSRGLSLIYCPLKANEQILNYILDIKFLDGGLYGVIFPIELPHTSPSPVASLAPSQIQACTKIISRLNNSVFSSNQPLILLLGLDTPSKLLIAQQVANELDFFVYRMYVEQLPTESDELQKSKIVTIATRIRR